MARKSRKVGAVIVALLLIFSTVFEGCQSGSGESQGSSAANASNEESPSKTAKEAVTIRFATYYTDGSSSLSKSYNDFLKKFQDTHKDTINLKIETSQGDNLRTKIKTDMAANNLPDVFDYWVMGAVKDMVNNGVLLNIDDYLKNSKSVTRDMFSDSSLEAYSFDGGKTVYGFPIEGSTAFFLANKDLFAKYGLTIPKTQDELYKVAEVFNQNGIVPLAIGSKGGNPAHFLYAEVYYQIANNPQQSAKNITSQKDAWKNPTISKVDNIILDMVNHNVFPKDPMANGDFGPAVALYNQGKAAMLMVFPWTIPNITSDTYKKSEMFVFPKLTDAVNDPASFTVGGTNNGVVINAKSYNDPSKTAAITELMDYLLSDEAYNLMGESGALPCKTMEYDKAKLNPLMVDSLDFTKDMKLYNNFWVLMPDPTSQEVFSSGMDSLWAKGTTSDSLDAKIQDSINKGLSS